jgi:hypothetical protein
MKPKRCLPSEKPEQAKSNRKLTLSEPKFSEFMNLQNNPGNKYNRTFGKAFVDGRFNVFAVNPQIQKILVQTFNPGGSECQTPGNTGLGKVCAVGGTLCKGYLLY